MPHSSWTPERTCAIAQAANVVGDWWSLLIVRDVARGNHRFDELVSTLDISRKVLTERLAHLVGHEVLEKRPYQSGPVRYEYHLTARGRALVPILVALQDWGDQWLLGSGRPTATTSPRSADARRIRGLPGSALPELALPATTGGRQDPVSSSAKSTVIFAYPATGLPNPLPEGWADIPGAIGCTLENRLFRAAYPQFAAAGVEVRGVSTQRPEEQRAFASAEDLPFPLLSDVDLNLAAALRLPTFRAADTIRLRRLVLIVGPDRIVTATRYPVADIPATIDWALRHG